MALAHSLLSATIMTLMTATYQNPILPLDYSDPDIVRVGDDFYLTASSFNCVPGLPILHSRDLVHWRLIGHALPRLEPETFFDLPQHGCGVWAPSIRHHDGFFYIYWGDPDHGVYMVKARDAAGPWDPPVLVRAAKGWIDTCPLWDADGQAYLVHAWANSRSGIKSILTVNRMNPEGNRILDEGVTVFDGHAHHPTIEGPKFYRRNGWYYIFAPAGGVKEGWQTVLRSRHVLGPYEDRVVLAQGATPVNGPHQGGWTDTAAGEHWFVHFQDQGLYGRVVHLQPLQWKADWPVIGEDPDGDGQGQPVLTHAVPALPPDPSPPADQISDDFASGRPGPQWQWHANPQAHWMGPDAPAGALRLRAVPSPEPGANLWAAPNLLLQKFPGRAFALDTSLDGHSLGEGDRAGLLIMGGDYAWIGLRRQGRDLRVVRATCLEAKRGTPESLEWGPAAGADPVGLRVTVADGGQCVLEFSLDGTDFQPLGPPFQAQPGQWIGAKAGLFCQAGGVLPAGHADFKSFQNTGN